MAALQLRVDRRERVARVAERGRQVDVQTKSNRSGAHWRAAMERNLHWRRRLELAWLTGAGTER
eukprot:5553404-Pleurochrysis_carterae.AAC.1